MAAERLGDDEQLPDEIQERIEDLKARLPDINWELIQKIGSLPGCAYTHLPKGSS